MKEQQLVAIFGSVFAFCFVGIAVWALRLKKRRREAFQTFADRHGLSVAHGSFPLLFGTVDGHAFSMGVHRLFGDGVRRGPRGPVRNIAEIAVTMELKGVPEGLVVARRGLFGKAMKSDVTTGDAKFDSKTIVRCPDPPAAQSYLTPERRSKLVALVDRKISLEEGGLRFGPASGKLLKLRHLEELSRPFFDAVQVLDDPPEGDELDGELAHELFAQQKAKNAALLAAAKRDQHAAGKEPFDLDALERIYDTTTMMGSLPSRETRQRTYEHKYYMLHSKAMTLEEFAKLMEENDLWRH